MLLWKSAIPIGPSILNFRNPLPGGSMVLRIFFVFFFFTHTTLVAQHHMHSSARVYVFRLKPHEDLKQSVLRFAKENGIDAGIVLSCAGSLEQYHLRFANQESGTKLRGHFEIVSFTGTFSASSAHLHLAVADSLGLTIGGHLLDENLIYTTAEIAIAALPDLAFDRITDSTYGYQELFVAPSKKKDKP
jgi:predicted DNA-binding protein with PD1-like motif